MNQQNSDIRQLKQEIQDVRRAYAAAPSETLRRILEEKEAALAALMQGAPPETPEAAVHTGGGASVDGNVTTGGGDFVGRDKIIVYQGAYTGAVPRTAEEIESTYRAVLAEMCRRVPLRGLGAPDAESPTGAQSALDLAGVYIQLDTTTTVAEERLQQALQTLPANPWDALRTERSDADRENVRQGVPLSAREAVVLFRKIVLLGDPGSGKTTFVHHLTFSLARKDWTALPSWPADERDALPVLVTLRDFSYWLERPENRKHGNARCLWAFLEENLRQRKLDFALPLLERALESGKAVVLLDGLDEVPPGETRRGAVLTAVQDFVQRYPDNRFVITCRILSYQDDAWKLPAAEYPSFTLKPFDEAKIKAFIQAWHNQLATHWNRPRTAVEKLEHKLQTEVFRRPDLRRLAPNPLLLTVMALVHTIDGELPETRVILYRRAVDILLWQWEQEKHKEYGRTASLLTLLQEAQRNKRDLLVALAELAYQAHGQVGRLDDAHRDDAVGIQEMDLLKRLRKLHPQNSLDWAESVVDILRLRSGLLVERTGGVFAFPHRTFQEYLAGVHLALQPDFAAQACRLGREGDFWRIVILLSTGYQVHERLELEKPRLLLEELCPPEVMDTSDAWRMAWLAGEVILEMGAQRLAEASTHGERLLARVRERLTDLVERGALTPAERLEAGDILGKLGDPRFSPLPLGEGPGVRAIFPVRFRGQPEPALGFVRIPAGEFWMGSAEDDEDAFDDEKPRHKVYLPEFWIARYPVTNRQYAAFIQAGGYDTERYWTPEGWAWRNGAAPDFTAIETFPDKDTVRQYKEWVLSRTDRSRPHFWGDPKWAAATRPVVGITWYEALAYCRWLEEQLKLISEQASAIRRQSEDAVLFWGAAASGNYRLTLPSEAEWEKAARGGLPSPDGRGAGGEGSRGDGVRVYPWGNDLTPDHANYDATSLKQTSPVGIFPKGATPETGLLDLSGNVWEWTRSKWGMDVTKPDYGYPYDAADGRENMDGPDLRVLRGGSWNDNRWSVRAAIRDRGSPYTFGNFIGFRVVFSPAERTK